MYVISISILVQSEIYPKSYSTKARGLRGISSVWVFCNLGSLFLTEPIV